MLPTNLSILLSTYLDGIPHRGIMCNRGNQGRY